MRLDINTPVGQVPAYNIPPTNPYAGATPGADEIYAIGMRNPYRFSFDRGGTNQLWAGDVGQDAIEEVDTIRVGGNYGWRVYEGTQCTGNDPGLCTPSNFDLPVFQYTSGGSAPQCAVTGGYVYRGGQGAVPKGAYIYGDYCTGEINMWNGGQQTLLLDTTRAISSFGEDEDGELYVVGLGGTVDKILGNKTSADFDGDLRTDFGVYRPSTGFWYLINSGNNNIRAQNFGVAGDIPAPKDYDGDRKADLAVFRPSDGNWYYISSGDNTFNIVNFGVSGDQPVSGDYDGDGKADIAVFRPSTSTWYVKRSTTGGLMTAIWGTSSDVLVPGDYDGDNRTDFAVWRPLSGTWYIINSASGTYSATNFGVGGDIPAPGDFDGDGKLDITVFRPTTGEWYTRKTLNNQYQVSTWGISGDIPVVGDYDADNKEDLAVFRPSTGFWYVVKSGGGISAVQWGMSGDVPVPSKDNP